MLSASAIVLLPIIAGCSLQRQQVEAYAKCNAAPFTSFSAIADCKTTAEQRTQFGGVQLPADLAELFQAKRKIIFTRVDRGLLGKDEAAVEEAQLRTDIMGMKLKRDAETARQTAQVLAAQPVFVNNGPSSSQMLLNAARDMDQQQQRAFDNMPKTTHCMPAGPGMNCTTY